MSIEELAKITSANPQTAIKKTKPKAKRVNRLPIHEIFEFHTILFPDFLNSFLQPFLRVPKMIFKRSTSRVITPVY